MLAGAGPTFCAGADAKWMASTMGYTEAENLRDAQAMAAMFRALDELPVPLICRIQGAALGGGAGLAAVSDIVVAEHDAVFGFHRGETWHRACDHQSASSSRKLVSRPRASCF